MRKNKRNNFVLRVNNRKKTDDIADRAITQKIKDTKPHSTKQITGITRMNIVSTQARKKTIRNNMIE